MVAAVARGDAPAVLLAGRLLGARPNPLSPYDTSSPWKKKGGWRELTWEMSEADAAEWARKNGYEIEKVPGSGKVYEDWDGRSRHDSNVAFLRACSFLLCAAAQFSSLTHIF